MGLINCISANSNGDIDVNKESKLQKRLLEAFPNDVNSLGGSSIYDSLFDKDFIDFFGDWFNPKSKFKKQYLQSIGIFDELGEPKLFFGANEFYFTNLKEERFPIKRNFLSKKDQLETINSLNYLYLLRPNNNVRSFVRGVLKERQVAWETRFNEVDERYENLDDNSTEEEYESLENEMMVLNEKISAVKRDILANPIVLDSIVKNIEANLVDYNPVHLDDVDEQEDYEPGNLDDISKFLKESSEIRDTNNIDIQIKKILSSIKDIDVDIEGIEHEKTSRILGWPMARQANEVKERIIDTISNIVELELIGNDFISDPYDLMMDKLRERQIENDDLIIRDFIDKVNMIKDSKSENDKEAFKTKFVTSFYKSQNVFTITEMSEDNGKLILRHINPASTQDKEAFISNEMIRSMINKFGYVSGNISNESSYNAAKELLLNFTNKKDIVEGLKLLGITLSSATINKLYRNSDNVYKGITKIGSLSLEDMFQNMFDMKIVFDDTTKGTMIEGEASGFKEIMKRYASSDLNTQKNILSEITSKKNMAPLYLISKYEAVNKASLSDSSMFVGGKQRWMNSLMSGMNKEILNWKAGNIRSLLNKEHKNLMYVNYLLALDSVDKGAFIKDSKEHKEESARRINLLTPIINSELKRSNDPNPTQHKEIGEADLHMDIFFKMFNFKDEIYNKIDRQQGISDQLKNASEARNINQYGYSADKSGSYAILGLAPYSGRVTLDENKQLVDLGVNNRETILNYMKGEFNTLINHSDLIRGYLNTKSKKAKQEYLMQYLIPDFHYSTKGFNAEDSENVLTASQINNGTWNKFGFWSSVQNRNKEEFDLLFVNEDGIMLADPRMTSKLKDIANFAEEEIIDIVKDNISYLNDLIVESGEGSIVSLFDMNTNIQDISGEENGTQEKAQLAHDYIVASMFNNLEMFSLFNGDLAFYKQKGSILSMEDALKRGPAILTDGLYRRQTSTKQIETYTSFNGKKFEVDKNKHVVTAVMNVLENDMSKYVDQINIGLRANGNNKLTYKHEVADASGIVSLPMYKSIVSGIYGWEDSDQAIYDRLSDPTHQYNDEDITWLKTAGRSMQPIKMTGFKLQEILNDKGEVIGEYPVYLKYSVFVMSPSVIAGTELEKLNKQMIKQNIDQIVFKSGSKASNKQATTIFNRDENGIFDGLKDDMKFNPFLFDWSGLKLQVELPTKFDKDGVLGNQHLKNLIANLDLNSPERIYSFRGEMLTAQELLDEYDGTIRHILQFQLNDFANKIGITVSEAGRLFDQTKLRKLIIDQLDINGDQDLIDILNDNSLPMETIPGMAQRAFPIVASYIHKNVGKVRTNSGSAIQVSNIGFDRISNENSNNVIYLSKDRELRPPLPATVRDLTQEELNTLTDKSNLDAIVYFDNDGNPSLDPESGKMRIKKARLMLPFSTVYKATHMSYNELKKAIESGKVDMRIFENIIGYRIPNQSISSNDSIEIVGILPPNMGDTAIVYHEITAKTGSDFDIDKMYLMMPNYSYNKDSGKVKYNSDDKSNAGQQNKLIELMGSILSAEKTYDDLISPLDSDIPKDAITEVSYLKSLYEMDDQESANKLMDKFKKLEAEEKSNFLKEFNDKRKLSPLQQLSPKGMVKSRVDMLQAKKLVATMANHMTDIPMSQVIKQIMKYDLGIEANDFYNMFTLGHEGNNEYKLTKIVSYLMNAAVDAAKDNYIIEGNFNSYTANAAMTMVRMGVDPVNVFKVLLNPEIMKLSQMKQLQTQKVTDIKLSQYSPETLNEYSKEFVTYIQNNKIDFNDFINTNEGSMSTNLVLGFWNVLQLAGKELNNDIVTSKSDSNGAGKNIYEHHVLWNRIERLFKESIGSDVATNFVRGKKLFKNGINSWKLDFTTDLAEGDMTFLGAMMNNSLFLTNFVTKQMFLENTDNYRMLVNRISNQLGEPLPINADNIKLMSNYIYPLVLAQSGHKAYNIDEERVKDLQSNFLQELIQKKRDNPNNQFLKELFVDASTNLISFPNFKFFDSNAKTLLKEDTENLYYQKDSDGNNTGAIFTNKLVQYAFLTTGFKPTFFSMNEFLPKSYFLNTGHAYSISRLIDRMNNRAEFIEDEFVRKAMTFMAINNENNYKIVKAMKSGEIGGDIFSDFSEGTSTALGLNDGKPVYNKTKLKSTIISEGRFYPFIRSKKSQEIYMLVDTEEHVDAEGKVTVYPIYRTINTNSETVSNENNQEVKKKTKVKLFDINTIKSENLLVDNTISAELLIQPELQYVSELSTIFGENNLNIETDSLSLQLINAKDMNNTYGIPTETWERLTDEERKTIMDQDELGCNG